MNRNDFLLPDELGWDCNDELNEIVKDKIKTLENALSMGAIKSGIYADVWIANLLDDIYAVIKKYQKEQKN